MHLYAPIIVGGIVIVLFGIVPFIWLEINRPRRAEFRAGDVVTIGLRGKPYRGVVETDGSVLLKRED